MKGAINFKTLLKPISAKQPVGENLRDDTSHASFLFQIKDKRSQARAAERQSSDIFKDKKALEKWSEVKELCTETLTKKTKDIEIITCLIESLLRLQHFEGLAAGFDLCLQLLKEFWEEIYPLPDEDGIETKIASLIGLNGDGVDGTLIDPIACVPLIQGRSKGPYAFWHYKQALDTSTITDPEKRQQRIDAGAVTKKDINTAVLESDPQSLISMQTTLTDCLDIFSQLTQFLDEKCGTDAPPTSAISDQLTHCLDCINAVMSENNMAPNSALIKQDEQESTSDPLASEEMQMQSINLHNAPINDRETALNVLLQIAAFFRRTEPHSPLPYVIERAVRWGRLPLPDLLKEILAEDSALQHICNLTGIEQAEVAES